MIIAGGAAGVAAAFNTPLAGVAFAIEELAAAYEQRVALLVMTTIMIAGIVSLGMAGDYVYFGAMRQILTVSAMLVICPVAGLVGGVTGGLFTRVVLSFADSRPPASAEFAHAPGIVCAAAAAWSSAVLGIVTGGGTWGTGYGSTRR